MLFSSLTFLTVFLPLALLVLWTLDAVAGRLRFFRYAPNAALLLLSLAFAFWHDGFGMLWLLGSALVNDGLARLIARASPGSRARRLRCGMAVAANLVFLGVFKYTAFAVGTVHSLLGTSIAVPAFLVPLGISFFTFSAISYVIDVARGTVAPARTPLESVCYLAMFPKLTAGPIVRYRTVAEALAETRPFDAALIVSGFRRLILGLAKKTLIADTVGAMADSVWALAGDGHGMPALMAWIGLVSYALQIYFDFSGYSDMAIGIGRMLGFRFDENFLHPYAATSIRDFWRRWHVSLSRWFRDYLYIPLGGNRKGLARTCLNSLVVFLLCGLWHDAGWMFVLWGLWHGLFITLERLFSRRKPGDPLPFWPALAGHVYATAAFLLGWLLFRSHGFADLGVLLQSLAGLAEASRESRALWLEMTPEFFGAFALGILFSYPVVPRVREWLGRRVPAALLLAAENTILTALAALCVFFLAGSSYHAFLYQQF